MIRTKARVIYHSSKHLPRIQMEFTLKEAELILKGHKNVTDVAMKDLQRAVEFANRNKPTRSNIAQNSAQRRGDG